MATYNKRGYKASKPEEEKVETDVNDIENAINVDEKLFKCYTANSFASTSKLL